MCAECSLFWFPRSVCFFDGLALPPTGFGCRELFIQSVPSDSCGFSNAGDPLLLCPYPREPRGHIQFPLGPGMWAGVGSVGGLFRSAVSGVPTWPGGEVSLPRGLGAESCCGPGSAGVGLPVDNLILFSDNSPVFSCLLHLFAVLYSCLFIYSCLDQDILTMIVSSWCCILAYVKFPG